MLGARGARGPRLSHPLAPRKFGSGAEEHLVARLGVDFDDLDFAVEFGLEKNLDLHGQLDFGDRGITAF